MHGHRDAESFAASRPTPSKDRKGERTLRDETLWEETLRTAQRRSRFRRRWQCRPVCREGWYRGQPDPPRCALMPVRGQHIAGRTRLVLCVASLLRRTAVPRCIGAVQHGGRFAESPAGTVVVRRGPQQTGHTFAAGDAKTLAPCALDKPFGRSQDGPHRRRGADGARQPLVQPGGLGLDRIERILADTWKLALSGCFTSAELYESAALIGRLGGCSRRCRRTAPLYCQADAETPRVCSRFCLAT